MKIQLIFGQLDTVEIPELLEAVDEYVIDSNPDCWDEAVKRALERCGPGKEFSEIRFMNVIIPDSAVWNLFRVPTVKAILDSVKGVADSESEV